MGTLRVWLKAGHTVEIIRRLLPEFTAQTGVEIELEVVPEYVAHDELVAGRAKPDVVTVPYWYLDELIARSVLRPVCTSAVGRDNANFPALALAVLSRDEQLWAIPHTFTGGTLSYRADIFERNGLEAPQSLDDVLGAARTLREKGWDLAARSSPEFSSLEAHAGWAAAKGITLLPRVGLPSLGDVIDGVGDLVEELRHSGAELATLDYGALADRVMNGRSAQFLDTSAWAFQFEAPRSPLRGRMGYATVGDKHAAQFLYAEGLGVTSWCADQSAAEQFIAWRHSERVVRAEVLEIRRIDVPRLDVRKHAWFDEFVSAQGLGPCLVALDESWARAELSHAPLRLDFVSSSRRLMSVISGTIAGRYPSIESAFGAVYRSDQAGAAHRDST